MRRCAADHNTLLNRKAGYTGTQWHAHPHHEDGMGPTTEVPALGQVRSLVYPEGFGAGKDGGLRVVPGGHLYRQARLEPNSDECASAPSLTATHPLPPPPFPGPFALQLWPRLPLSDSRSLQAAG